MASEIPATESRKKAVTTTAVEQKGPPRKKKESIYSSSGDQSILGKSYDALVPLQMYLPHHEIKGEQPNGYDTYQVSRVSLVAPPSLMTFMASVFSPGKTYRFRMSRIASLVTSGAGLMNLSTAIYPQQFDQYAVLNALFAECRLRSTNIRYTPRVAPGVTTVAQVTVCTVFDPSNSIAGGVTYTGANRIPGSKVFALVGTKYPVRHSFNKTRGRMWSTVPTTSVGSDPVGGVIGSWIHTISGTTSASATILDYVILADYEFRNVI